MPNSRVVHSFCRLCQAACGILVEVHAETDGDRVVKVSGDPDHPISQGYTCSKGRSIPAQHHHGDRLDDPELNGHPSEWDTVLGDLSDRLRLIIDEHGSHAVALYRSGGWAFDATGRFFIDTLARGLRTRSIFSSVTLDTPAKLLTADLIAGTPFLLPVPDTEHMQLLILIGQNPVVSHGHGIAWPTALTDIRAMQARGGSLVVVDPRTTESAANADVHLAVRPGTDAALLAFLVRHALATRPDRAYLATSALPGSVDRLQAAVARFDRDHVAAFCDVSANDLDRVAELVTRPGRLITMCGTGTSMGPTPNVAEWLSWALNIVTGSLDRQGGPLFNPGFLRPQEGGLTGRSRFTGERAPTRPELAHQYGELPSVVLADEILAGNIRALLVMGGNPARVFPDSAKVTKALKTLDVLAVCDLRRTETTALATHVLAGTSQLERADMPAFVDGSFPQAFTQYSTRVVAPAGQRRPTWWITGELGNRLGIGMPDMPAGGYLAESSEDELLAQGCRRSRVPFDEIRAAPSGLLAHDAPAPGWMVPDALPHGGLDAAPIEIVAQLTQVNLDPAEPRLVLITRRLPHLMNSTLKEVNADRRGSEPTLMIHPDEVVRLGLLDGMAVQIRSQHGSTTAVVESSPTIRTGVVSLPHGFGVPDANGLTSDNVGIDSLTGMPRFSSITVTLTPVAV